MSEVALGIFAVLISILGAAVINMVEIAVISANRIRVHHLSEQGSRAAQALERMHRGQERFFAAIVILQTFLVVFAGAMGGRTAERISDNFLVVLGATALTAWATAQFGDLIPKVLAAKAGDRFALAVALPTEAVTRTLGPIVQALAFLPRVLSERIFGVDLDSAPTVTEAELRMLIESSAESGSVDEEEAELLDRVFHFGDRRVHEVMIPRTEAVWVPSQSRLRDFYAIYAVTPHSRFPVFEETPDRVVGVLGIKDVLAALAAGRVDQDSEVTPLLRPAYFVPESKLIGELFREMQERGLQMAIAVDEFGGTAGIVTLEQLLEEMVGTVHDELRPEDPEIQTIDENTIEVDGSLSVEEAREELGIDIPAGPYDTIAGFLLSQLGHIPQTGEQLPIDGHRITIIEMRGQKIERLRVTKA